jgi:superoxide dismutase, Cu-Zn family
MIRSILLLIAPFFACAAIVLNGCESSDKKGGAPMRDNQMGKTGVANIQPSKGAATQPANKSVTGTATFTQVGNDVHVVANVNGLSPGKHGFHIHEKGDLSDPSLVSAGAHYNPGKHKHGGPDTPEHHAGDLGNITADASGHGMVDVTMRDVKLDDLVGRSVIVHAAEDDLKTDPSGNSGGRVAGGVIEMKK